MKTMPHLLCLLLLYASACGNGETPPVEPLPDAIAVLPIATGLASLTALTAPASDARLFIVERPGRIRVFKDGAVLPTPYIDIHTKLTFGGERGLLGLAFHPDFATN